MHFVVFGVALILLLFVLGILEALAVLAMWPWAYSWGFPLWSQTLPSIESPPRVEGCLSTSSGVCRSVSSARCLFRARHPWWMRSASLFKGSVRWQDGKAIFAIRMGVFLPIAYVLAFICFLLLSMSGPFPAGSLDRLVSVLTVVVVFGLIAVPVALEFQRAVATAGELADAFAGRDV